MGWSEQDAKEKREADQRRGEALVRCRRLGEYGINTYVRYVGAGRTDGGVEMGPRNADALLELLDGLAANTGG